MLTSVPLFQDELQTYQTRIHTLILDPHLSPQARADPRAHLLVD